MAKMLDIFLIYQFLRRLVTPFERWEAFKTGVIDKDGNVVVSKLDRTSEQDRSWGYYDRLLANLKKLLAKIPGGRTRLASFAAALLLLREQNIPADDDVLLESMLEQYITEAETLVEDNIVGGGNIAGLGIGDDGEPPVRKKKKKIRSKQMDESYWSEVIW